MLTFVDTGVLITAARGQGDAALHALNVLDDPGRTFASSLFVKLEAIPMPTYHKRDHEVAFLNAFFDRVDRWPESNDEVIERAFAEASFQALPPWTLSMSRRHRSLGLKSW